MVPSWHQPSNIFLLMSIRNMPSSTKKFHFLCEIFTPVGNAYISNSALSEISSVANILLQTSFGPESKWNFHLPAGEIRWTLSAGKSDFLHTIDLTSNKRWAQWSENALHIFCADAKHGNIIQACYIFLLNFAAIYSYYILHTHGMELSCTWCYIVRVQ